MKLLSYNSVQSFKYCHFKSFHVKFNMILSNILPGIRALFRNTQTDGHNEANKRFSRLCECPDRAVFISSRVRMTKSNDLFNWVF
jgi:hypothetical protein